MSKGKILAFSAAVAAAVVAVVLSGTRSGDVSDGGDVSPKAPQLAEVASPLHHAAATASVSTNQTPTVHGTLPVVLASATPFGKPLILVAESMGAKTVSTLSRNELLVEADAATRARLSADSRFESVSELSPSSKVQPALAALIAGGATTVDVAIISLAAEYRPFVMSCLRSGGGEMLKGCINEGDTIRAALPAALVAELASRGDVRWMERYERPQLMNDIAVDPQAMNVRAVWGAPHGLTGAGQNISTSDSGIDTGDKATLHRDLRNRVKAIKVVEGCVSRDVIGHGTHTAGSIVGDGTESSGQIRGTAYGANLYAWFCSDGGQGVYTPESMDELYTNQGEWDAHIHSGSWGLNSAGEYTADCAEHDRYVWEHPEFLPVFSAGNKGAGARTIGSPAAAKNVLAVGATQNLRTEGDGGTGNGDPAVTASYSSRGPCLDGRVKPDVASPGTGVLSTRAHGVDYSYGNYNEFYAYDTGTSMACPLTAGAVALVRQWLVERKGFADEDGKRPTAALMKAVVMGGAKDAAVPNNDQGWGRVDLEETLFPSDGRAVMLVDRIPFEQDFVTNIVVETTNAAPLDVQLVWVDYPGAADADQKVSKLVNDLDLTVEARIPGEKTLHYGNGGDAPDALNNAESIHIGGGVATKYVITVSCRNIPYDYTQGGAAALYVRGAFDPGAKVEPPAYVHLKKLDRDFLSLDRALEAVRDEDETVEILDWVSLDNPVTVTTNLTIAATGADASASYVARLAGASLTIATNATVTLSNVVFAASAEPLADVQGLGCLKLGPKTVLGVGLDAVAVTTADADGFELAGEPSQKLMLRCAEASGQGESFGTYSCTREVADNCAAMIICADDPDHETRGAVGANGRLVWERMSVPMDEAAGYFVDDEGKTNTYYRLERALAEFKRLYDAGSSSEFVVLRDGPLDLSFKVDSPLTIRGEGAVRPVMAAGGDSGFGIVVGGSLVLSNLVFRGGEMSAGRSFVAVEGGELTLAQGAVLDGFVGYRDAGSGVIDAVTGVVNVLSGASIVNCAAMGDTTGKGLGGAIYVDCEPSCTLNLMGGTIAFCYASAHGGGVYVYNWPGYAPTVNLSGALDIAENGSGNADSDNVGLFTASELSGFRLTGAVQGDVGVRYVTYEQGKPTGNAESEAFMVDAAGATAADAGCFFSDTDASLKGAVGEDGVLVWERTSDDGQCEPDVAKVLQIDRNGSTNYYANVEQAFGNMGEDSPYVVELLDAVVLSNSVTVLAGRAVTLRVADGRSAALTRDGDFGFVVPAGASLALTNVCVSGRGDSLAYLTWQYGGDDLRSVPFFDVAGGRLELQSGAEIRDVLGYGNRASGAVTVYEGGTFVMTEGSLIDSCTNAYESGESEVDYGVGAGLLVDGVGGSPSAAYLWGGVIRDCWAGRGSAVNVCNGAEVHVAGAMRVEIDEPDRFNDFVVDDSSQLLIDEPVTGVYNMSDGVNGPYHDTNYVGRITWNWAGEFDTLTNSAACFVHSVSGDVGMAATNQTDAIVVWSSAVHNGVYTNANGVGYIALGEKISPEKYIVITNSPIPFAFKSMVCGESTCTARLGDLVASARYMLFRTNSLAGGFDIKGVEPFTNFTAEADGPVELELPLDPAPQFWRALGVETYTTNYFDK